MTLPRRVDRAWCGEWFQRNGRRTRQWCALVVSEAYYERPPELVRQSFRSCFRARYPDPLATFRGLHR